MYKQVDISIITIVLNRVNEIEDTLLSVIKQEGVNVEYIVIDGGSVDGTLEIIDKYSDYITHFESGPDGGIYKAINKGVLLASSDIVGLIHCGDAYTPGALQQVCSVFRQKGADIVYGDILIKEKVDNRFFFKMLEADHSALTREMSIFHPSTFITLTAYREMNYYDTTFRSAADYELLLRMFRHGKKFVHIPQVLAIFDSGGLSASNFKLSLNENFRIRIRHFGKLSAYSYFAKTILYYYFFSLRKKIIVIFLGRKMFEKMKVAKKKISNELLNRRT